MFKVGDKVKIQLFDCNAKGVGIITDYDENIGIYRINVIESDELAKRDRTFCTESEMELYNEAGTK